MADRVVLLGAGSHARVVLDILRAAGWPVEVAALVDACPERGAAPQEVEGFPVLTRFPEDVPEGVTGAVPAVGENALRRRLSRQAREAGLALMSALHPAAVVSGKVLLGEGAVICPGAVIVTGATLGDGVIVNTGATVDHDCRLGDFCHIAPGAHLAGRVEVGERAWVGIGASVKQGIRIGADALVGAGAAVVEDVPEGATVLGVPARPRKG